MAGATCMAPLALVLWHVAEMRCVDTECLLEHLILSEHQCTPPSGLLTGLPAS